MICEKCGKSNAKFFSGNYKTGKWSIQCYSCGDDEYWIPCADFNQIDEEWMDHLREKRWFNETEFEAMLERYVTI